MRDRGFTLVELAVSVCLTGVVTVAISSVFLTGLRTYAFQMELAQVRANLRLATATITRELRGLDAGDLSGSDITEMAPTALTYRAHRSTNFLCRLPDVSNSTVTVWQQPHAGLRQLQQGRDSLLLFAENDVSIATDNAWFSAALNSVSSGNFCPGGVPGFRLGLQGATDAELRGVSWDGVVRGFQMTRILLYRDADGRYWVGLREWRPGGGWTITQPILGPVDRDGLRFEYFGSNGGLAGYPSEITRIAVHVVGVGYRQAEAGLRPASLVRDSLTIHVGLRNNPRRR